MPESIDDGGSTAGLAPAGSDGGAGSSASGNVDDRRLTRLSSRVPHDLIRDKTLLEEAQSMLARERSK